MAVITKQTLGRAQLKQLENHQHLPITAISVPGRMFPPTYLEAEPSVTVYMTFDYYIIKIYSLWTRTGLFKFIITVQYDTRISRCQLS